MLQCKRDRLMRMATIKGDVVTLLRQIRSMAVVAAVTSLVMACTAQFVAPYSSDLQQKASSMQAEVSSWDLTMRGTAGTIAADPRHPDVTAMLNKWRGEADAMLTLAVSNDPNAVNCSDAAKAVFGLIEPSLPPSLRSPSPPSNPNTTSSLGCQAVLVSGIQGNIDAIQRGLKFCQADWIPDSYFAALAQNRTAAAKPPAAPTMARQDALNRSCFAEFKPAVQTPSNAADAQHGRAVSALLTTLQVIVYVENRKKAAASTK